jgi:hypothetical protein
MIAGLEAAERPCIARVNGLTRFASGAERYRGPRTDRRHVADGLGDLEADVGHCRLP